MIKIIAGSPKAVEKEYNEFISQKEVFQTRIAGTSESQGEEGFGISLIVEYEHTATYIYSNNVQIEKLLAGSLDYYLKTQMEDINTIIDDYYDDEIENLKIKLELLKNKN